MLSNSTSQLIEALNLLDVSSEEDLGPSLLALLTTARESSPKIPLSRIAHEIFTADAASLLDPLDTLPVLLPCKDPAAREILSFIGECGSAKETLMAIQEAAERLISSIDKEDEDGDITPLSFPSQLVILVDLYTACIPRLKMRRQTTSEIIRPLLAELEDVIRLSSSHTSREEGRNMISSVSQLVIRLEAWVRSINNEETDEANECSKLLESILDCSLITYEHCIHSALAQRTLELLYPRLAYCSAVMPDWEAGEEVISDASNAYSSLNIPTDAIFSTTSLQRMIVFAHSGLTTSVSSHLTKLVPIIVRSLQTNCGVDGALTILLYALDPLKPPPRPYLSEEVTHPLFAVLSPLSSSHPDPLVRHQTFRILSLLVSSCPPPFRLHLLRELSQDETFPQMRVAAIGLVKNAVLEGLSSPPNLFASPAFFDAFSEILFKPSPPDFLADQFLSIDKFHESSEPARLVECLGAYYTILQRDKNNLTRIRNADILRNVEGSLLTPLRMALSRLAEEQKMAHNHEHNHDELLLGSLQVSIDRVDGAISQLRNAEQS